MKDEKQKEQSAIVGEATSETADEYIEVDFLLAELKGIEKQMDTVENCLAWISTSGCLKKRWLLTMPYAMLPRR